MKRLLRRLVCWLIGHELWEVEVLSERSSRVRCNACPGQWIYNRECDAWLPWTPEIEEFYRGWWRRRA